MPPKKFSQEHDEEHKKQKKQWEEEFAAQKKRFEEELEAQRKNNEELQKNMAAMEIQQQEVNKSASTSPPSPVVTRSYTGIVPTQAPPSILPTTFQFPSPNSMTNTNSQHCYHYTLSHTYYPDRNIPSIKMTMPPDTYNLSCQVQTLNQCVSHTLITQPAPTKTFVSIPTPSSVFSTFPTQVPMVQDPKEQGLTTDEVKELRRLIGSSQK